MFCISMCHMWVHESVALSLADGSYGQVLLATATLSHRGNCCLHGQPPLHSHHIPIQSVHRSTPTPSVSLHSLIVICFSQSCRSCKCLHKADVKPSQQSPARGKTGRPHNVLGGVYNANCHTCYCGNAHSNIHASREWIVERYDREDGT